jgi:hypothetical protein
MKTIITILITLFSISSFSQGDIKYDIFEQVKQQMSTLPTYYTKVVDFDKPDTCYIHVYSNDTSAITIMKNTYGLKTYESYTSGKYKFYFPKSSSARIMTNLEGGRIKYTVDKVIVE